jgi:hypothetical protein
MNKNQFFIVGAQRSGTTYLYNILEQHPEICMAKPVKPEPKYFLNKQLEDINLEEYYKTYYCSCKEAPAFGEKSTSYYENEEVAKTISSAIPHAKIIFCLRNPLTRALSNYQFSVDHGLETRTLEEVFIENKPLPNNNFSTSVNPFNYLGRGEYATYIKIYKKYFSKHQIKVIIFEELVNDQNAIKQLYDFLEVDPTFQPFNINNIINASSKKGNYPESVILKINDHYKSHNKELSEMVENSLNCWKI